MQLPEEPITPTILTEDQFIERFRPIKNRLRKDAPYWGCMFETFGDEEAFVKAADPDRVWTVVDCDGTPIITNGWHYVNRVGYIITEVPVVNGEFYEVPDKYLGDPLGVQTYTIVVTVDCTSDADAEEVRTETAGGLEDARDSSELPNFTYQGSTLYRGDLLEGYQRLHDMLSDMIEGGRLKEADIPDDYQALVRQLEVLANREIK